MLFSFRPLSKRKKCVDHEKSAYVIRSFLNASHMYQHIFSLFPFVRKSGFLTFYKKEAKTRLIYCIVVTYAKVNITGSFTHSKIYIFRRDFSRLQTQENYSMVLYPMLLCCSSFLTKNK